MRAVVVVGFVGLSLVRCDCGDPAAPPDGGTGSDAGEVPDVPCEPAVVAVAAVPAADAVVVAGARTIVGSATGVVSYAGDGASLAQENVLIPAPSEGTWSQLAVGGTRIVAAQGGSGAEVATRELDGSGDAATFDIYSYAEYEQQLALGANAYNASSGHVAATATRIYVHEAQHGGLIVLDAATMEPLGAFLNLPDDRALQGAEALFVEGDYLVAVIARSGIGIDALHAVRVFDVSDPANIAITGQSERGQSNGDHAVYDAARDRYLIGSLPQGAASRVDGFTVDPDGVPSAVALLHESTGPQVRELAISGDLLVVNTPTFGDAPAVEATLFDATTTPLTVVDTVEIARVSGPMAASADYVFLGGAGEMQAISVAGCP